MKKYLLILLTGMVLLVACQDSVLVDNKWIVDLQGYYLDLDTTEITFDNPGDGTAVLNVVSEGTPWIITEVPDWITLSADRGTSSTAVTVSVTEYKKSGNRTGFFTFSSDVKKWSYTKDVYVKQVGSGPYIELAESSFSFDGNAHREIVAASSNFDWCYVADNTWITVEQTEDGMVVSVEINDTGWDRNGKVYVCTPDSERMATINVYQSVAKASISPQGPLHFDLGGGSCTLTVTSEAPWKVDASNSWWNVSPNSGEPGTTEVSVDVSWNSNPGERSARIGFHFAHAARDFATIEISQVGAYLELSDESVLQGLSSLGGEAHVTLIANIPWEITEIPDFITITPMSGEGTTDLTLTYSSNQSFENKDGNLFIGWVGHSSRWSYWVHQRSRVPGFSGPGVSLGSSYLSDNVAVVQCDASVQTLSVIMDIEGPWSIVYERSFFDVSPTSSTGACTFAITVDENDTGEYRSGYINIRPRGVPTYDDSQPSPWYIEVCQDR